MTKKDGKGGLPFDSAARCYVIAEAGVNHDGDPERALLLVDAAVAAGADAVKFQTFRTEDVISPVAEQAAYQAANTGRAESQLDMVKRLELRDDDFRRVQAHCRARGITFVSTPFDEASVDLLASLDVPFFKTGSGELTNLGLLARIAAKGRPMVISTGMANLGEVEAALRCVREAGDPPVVLLHCVSNYPADPADANLRAMATLATAFGVPVGYSDHTLGQDVALAAVALGARVLEKHLTLDTTAPGPDHKASLDPPAFAALVRAVRTVESALGTGRKEPAASEAGVARVARRSLVAARDLAAGHVLSTTDLVARRPGAGLAPSTLPLVLGRKLRAPLQAGRLLALDMLA